MYRSHLLSIPIDLHTARQNIDTIPVTSSKDASPVHQFATNMLRKRDASEEDKQNMRDLLSPRLTSLQEASKDVHDALSEMKSLALKRLTVKQTIKDKKEALKKSKRET